MAEKRDALVSLRLTKSDLDKMNKAAARLWPGAVLTQSGTILGLARLGAEQARLQAHKKKNTDKASN
jgi:hypothetical protein